MITGFFFTFSCTLATKSRTPASYTCSTHNHHANGNGNYLRPPCPLACPVNFSLQGIFILNNSGNKTQQPARNTSTTGEKGQTDARARSLQPHTPPAVDMEAQKCASMSWQHRLLALSASDNVAGTWKHISVASRAPVPYTTPLCCHDNPMA